MTATMTTTDFAALHARAHAAGHEAALAAIPTPMTVVGGVPGGPQQVWHEPEGACGFAWVRFPGNTAWGRWAKANGVAKKHWQSGLEIWVGGYDQSVARKEAYAAAYAKVLHYAGIEAYAGSRLD